MTIDTTNANVCRAGIWPTSSVEESPWIVKDLVEIVKGQPPFISPEDAAEPRGPHRLVRVPKFSFGSKLLEELSGGKEGGSVGSVVSRLLNNSPRMPGHPDVNADSDGLK